MSRKISISAEAFVRAWMTSRTLAEVALKMGKTKLWCCQRAVHYRKRGVKLPKFKVRAQAPRVNVAKLNDLISEYNTFYSEGTQNHADQSL